MKKWLILIAVITGILLTACENSRSAQDGMLPEEKASEAASMENTVSAEAGEVPETETASEAFSVSIDVREHYTTNIGDPSNLYRIDENGVLWGCGNNSYGQLGQGTQDDEFHSEMVKIAENVVHVDYSQSGFVIWLTEGVEMVWTGRMEENVDCDSIEEFNGEYPRAMENTVIRISDGSYRICGANVGEEEKILPVYYEATDYPLVCTSEFLPFDYDGEKK